MLYTFFGDIMKVKVIDEGHEKDLEESITLSKKIISI